VTKVGVVAALPAEAAAFCGRRCAVGRVQNFGSAVLACCGIGGERAHEAAEDLVARGVVGLISWGISGGLAPELNPGDLLLPTEVRNESGATWACEPSWQAHIERRLRRGLSVHVGTQFSCDQVVSAPAEKQRLFLTGAQGVDMESAAVAAVASSAELPFIAIRAVCDPSDCAIPRSAVMAVGPDGRFKLGSFLFSMLIRPADLRGLMRLRSGLRSALGSLAEAVRLNGGLEGMAEGVGSKGPSIP